MDRKISFYDFTLLPDEQQFEFLFAEGKFIDSRKAGNSKFVMYALYGFCVELEYDISQNKIVGKVVFQRKGELFT